MRREFRGVRAEKLVPLAVAWNESAVPPHELGQIGAHAFAERRGRILSRSEAFQNTRRNSGRIESRHPKSPSYLVGGLGIDRGSCKHVDGRLRFPTAWRLLALAGGLLRGQFLSGQVEHPRLLRVMVRRKRFAFCEALTMPAIGALI